MTFDGALAGKSAIVFRVKQAWARLDSFKSLFSWPAIYVIIGGLFIAAWWDYAYEAVAVYTAEYQNPRSAETV